MVRPVCPKGLAHDCCCRSRPLLATPARAAPVRYEVSRPIIRPSRQAAHADPSSRISISGTVILGPGTWCGCDDRDYPGRACSAAPIPNVTCTGAAMVAKYNVTGTNNQVRDDHRAQCDADQPARPDEDAHPGRGQSCLVTMRNLGQARPGLLDRRIDQLELDHGRRPVHRHLQRHRRLLRPLPRRAARNCRFSCVMVDRK